MKIERNTYKQTTRVENTTSHQSNTRPPINTKWEKKEKEKKREHDLLLCLNLVPKACLMKLLRKSKAGKATLHHIWWSLPLREAMGKKVTEDNTNHHRHCLLSMHLTQNPLTARIAWHIWHVHCDFNSLCLHTDGSIIA